jgi:hypothetical protein
MIIVATLWQTMDSDLHAMLADLRSQTLGRPAECPAECPHRPAWLEPDGNVRWVKPPNAFPVYPRSRARG